MKKTSTKKIIVAGIVTFIIIGILYFTGFKVPGAVFKNPFANPGEEIEIINEMYVTLYSGNHCSSGTDSCLNHIYWRLVDSNGVVGSTGKVPLTDDSKSCLIKKITDKTSKLCYQTFKITTPQKAGGYTYKGTVADSNGNLISSIQLDTSSRILTVGNINYVDDSGNTVKNCKPSGYDLSTKGISNGDITIKKYIEVTATKTDCIEKVSSTKYIVNCDTNYHQEGSGLSSSCVKDEINKPAVMGCTEDTVGTCINNNLNYQKCVDGSLKEATLSCSSSQSCSEKEQRCIDKEVEDNFIIDDNDNGDIIIDEDDVVEKQSFFEQYKTETYIISALLVVLIIVLILVFTGKKGGKRK